MDPVAGRKKMLKKMSEHLPTELKEDFDYLTIEQQENILLDLFRNNLRYNEKLKDGDDLPVFKKLLDDDSDNCAEHRREVRARNGKSQRSTNGFNFLIYGEYDGNSYF